MFWRFSAQNNVAYDRTLPRLTPLGSRLIRGWSAIVAAPDTFILISTHMKIIWYTYVHIIDYWIMYYIYNISNIFLYPKNASICSISRSGLRMVAPNPWAALGPSAPTTGTGCLAPRTAPSVPRRAIIQSSSDALRCWWTRWNMRFRIHEYIYIYIIWHDISLSIDFYDRCVCCYFLGET